MLGARYVEVPLKFTVRADTSDGRFEIAGTGSGRFRVGVASLMPADNVSGFKAATIRYLKELGIEIARWPGGNFVRPTTGATASATATAAPRATSSPGTGSSPTTWASTTS